jgi:hypothetical protein
MDQRRLHQDIEAIEARGVNLARYNVISELPSRSGSEVAKELNQPYLLLYLLPDQVGSLLFGSNRIHYVTIHVLSPEEVSWFLALPGLEAIRDHALLLDPLRMAERPILGPRITMPAFGRPGGGVEYILPDGFPREAVVGELESSALQTLLAGKRIQSSQRSSPDYSST